jgi:AcrR family transcriptional regulator
MTVTQTLSPRQERSDQVRESIVAAASSCLAEGGFTSDRLMSAVARAAGVSRPTVYRYFPTFADLRTTVVQRELAILVTEVLPMLETLTWTEDAIVDLLAYVVSYARRHPLFVAALRDVPDQVLAMFTLDAGDVVGYVQQILGPMLQVRIDEGAIPPMPVERIVDVLARLALSLAFTNTGIDTDNPRALRRYLRDAFALVRLLA